MEFFEVMGEHVSGLGLKLLRHSGRIYNTSTSGRLNFDDDVVVQVCYVERSTKRLTVSIG